jgi:type IV pilus assembly protein PilA
VILGVLAAVAVPAFIRYIRRAKTSEAEDKISEVYRSAVSYLSQEKVQQGVTASAIDPQFPGSVGPTPGNCTTCAANADGRCNPAAYSGEASGMWGALSWVALNFSIADPHYFVYQFTSANVAGARGVGSGFTARAQADLDQDNVCSTFERAAVVTTNGDVQGSRGIYRNLPTE